MVREFHEKHGLVVRDAPIDRLPTDEVCLRQTLLREEVQEYLKAQTAAERAKEAADILCILYGDALHVGFELDAVFKTVHESNMTKDGGKRLDGKVLKGDSYHRPDIDAVIRNNPQEQPV